MFIETTTAYDEIIRHITAGGVVFIVGVILKEYKIYQRIKERVNSMYVDYCFKHKLKYDSVENGKR